MRVFSTTEPVGFSDRIRRQLPGYGRVEVYIVADDVVLATALAFQALGIKTARFEDVQVGNSTSCALQNSGLDSEIGVFLVWISVTQHLVHQVDQHGDVALVGAVQIIPDEEATYQVVPLQESSALATPARLDTHLTAMRDAADRRLDSELATALLELAQIPAKIEHSRGHYASGVRRSRCSAELVALVGRLARVAADASAAEAYADAVEHQQ
jgi:hypothetical protein